jgi:hypothetical protein
MTFQGRCKNSQERCKTISGEVHTSSYEMHIEFVNFVISKLEYCQKSGRSLSGYDCLETELKALCCVVV